MSTQRTVVLVLAFSLLAGCAGPSSSRSGSSTTSGERALPMGADAAVNRLRTLDKAGRHDEMLALVAQELPRARTRESRAWLEYYHGRALAATGRGQSAILAYKRALEAAPDGSHALVRDIHTGWADAAMGARQWHEAARQYEAASRTGRQTRPQREAYYYAIHLALKEAGDPAAAKWKDEILIFDAGQFAAAEQRLLGREPPPPVVAVAPLPVIPAGGIPTDPRQLLASIHPRAAWGAAAIRGKFDAMTPIQRVTVHHSALDTSASGSASAVAAEIRQLQSNHQEKWADIGYHFLIDRSGGIWEGRNLQWQGAHEGTGLNKGAVGVCLLGNFELGPPTAQQLAALKQLLDACRGRWSLTAADIKTHKEVRPQPTECPGWALQGWVDDYRRSLSLNSLARQ